jgi:glycosyltransferase involved in cell wall biosynthesis
MTSHVQDFSAASPDPRRDSGWENPQVAVVMTVCRGFPYLRAAVESIFDQTYQAFDFIIVNGGSTDGMREYLDSPDDPRVRVIRQDLQGQQAATTSRIPSDWIDRCGFSIREATSGWWALKSNAVVSHTRACCPTFRPNMIRSLMT